LTLLAVMAAVPDERPTRERVTGLLIGFAGVLAVLGVWRGVGAGDGLGSLACLAAAASYGLGFAHNRRNLSGRPESVVVLWAAQLLCGVVELGVVTALFAGPPRSLPPEVLA